jgi:hypothetical protein
MVGEDDVPRFGLVFQERYASQRGCLELLSVVKLDGRTLDFDWTCLGREEWRNASSAGLMS